MLINENCIHDVMHYLAVHLDIIYENYKVSYKTVSVYEIIEYFAEKYTPQDIIYTINLLSQGGYIYGTELQNIKISVSKQKIHYLTYHGQKFYESIQSDPIWGKTKNVIKKVGVHSLEFIESVAHDFIVESGKQAISVILSQQPND